ncbi:Peptide deformylase [hydrothermal vent metagenome]|uniref:Peptide deformylase n=1 Tax=hydrothermal vent metagenome TaxID=652676 RepID=A0A3B1AK89_9ZZZZ
MAILQILRYPDSRLRIKAKSVKQVDGAIQQLVDDMLETMYKAPGIGLAATQINIAKCVLVLDLSEEHDEPLCLINPEIIAREGEEETEEGCLSVPDVYESITRSSKIQVTALDRDGNPLEFAAEGMLAVCIQHEIDHLNGKLFVDHLSSLKRQRIRKKLAKETRNAEKKAI